MWAQYFFWCICCLLQIHWTRIILCIFFFFLSRCHTGNLISFHCEDSPTAQWLTKTAWYRKRQSPQRKQKRKERTVPRSPEWTNEKSLFTCILLRETGRLERWDADWEGGWSRGRVFEGHRSPWGCSPQDTVTLKGVNADWAKARQRAHVRTHSLQRAQTGFTAEAGSLLQPFLTPSPLSVSSASLTASDSTPH